MLLNVTAENSFSRRKQRIPDQYPTTEASNWLWKTSFAQADTRYRLKRIDVWNMRVTGYDGEIVAVDGETLVPLPGTPCAAFLLEA